jgi:hypothetical protein
MNDIRLAARIANLLRNGDASASDIVSRLGCGKSPCRRILLSLRGNRAIHISHYRTGTNGCSEAVYQWGEGVDAAAPVAKYLRSSEESPIHVPKLGPWGCVW